MLVAILAALVAQSSPPPSAAAPAPASSSTATPPSSMPVLRPGFRTFPRGPRAVPEQLRAGPHDVVIRNTGSTNAAGYTIVVHRTGPADVADAGGTRTVVLDRADVAALFARVSAAGPFSTLAGGRCMKSASFGSSTFVTYGGATTPDLSCPGSPQTRAIGAAVAVIVGEARVRSTPGRIFRLQT